MKTTKQLIKEIDRLKKKLKWMTTSRKFWRRTATTQARHIRQLMNERPKKIYEVFMTPDNKALYEVAKQITLEKGFDYHHPLTGKITKYETWKKKTKTNSKR